MAIEVLRKRTPTGRHHSLGNRQFSFTTLMGTPVNYGEGLANTVDMRPQRILPSDNNPKMSDGWVVNNNSWHYALGKPADKPLQDGWVGFGGKEGAHWFKFRLTQLIYLHISTQGVRTFTPKGGLLNYNRANLNDGETESFTFLDDSEVYLAGETTWSNVLEGTDVRWLRDGRRLKEVISMSAAKHAELIANPPLANQQNRTGVAYAFEIDDSDIPRVVKNGVLQNGTYDDDDGESLELRTTLDELLAFLPIDYAYMADNPEIRVPLTKRIFSHTDGKRYLCVGMTWATFVSLPAGEILFDPTLDTQPAEAASSDTYMNAGAATTNYDSDFNLKTGLAGGDITRTLIRFDCSSIPAGSMVDDATLKLYYGFADNPSSRPHSAYPVIRAWIEDQATWNVYATASNWGTAGCDNTSTDRSATAMATWVQPGSFGVIVDIALDTSIVETWCGVSNEGMLLKQDTETDGFTKSEWGNSRDGTAANRPRLVVNYTEVVPELELEGYRLVNNDGDEDGSTFMAAQDTPATIAKNVTFRLRVLVNSSGDFSNGQFTLRYKHEDDDTYVDVTP